VARHLTARWRDVQEGWRHGAQAADRLVQEGRHPRRLLVARSPGGHVLHVLHRGRGWGCSSGSVPSMEACSSRTWCWWLPLPGG